MGQLPGSLLHLCVFFCTVCGAVAFSNAEIAAVFYCWRIVLVYWGIELFAASVAEMAYFWMDLWRRGLVIRSVLGSIFGSGGGWYALFLLWE